jgi:hypothetical protein
MKIVNTVLGVCLLLLVTTVFAQEVPGTLQAEFVFEVRAELSPAIVNGETSDGRRLAIPITGGDFTGENIRGEVLAGGADYQLVRPDGVTEVQAVYMIRTDDGALINVVNEGIIVPPVNAGGAPYIRTTPKFTAPIGKYDWLNKNVFLSNLVVKPERPGMVFVQIYRVR